MLTQERIETLFRLSALNSSVIDPTPYLKSLNDMLDYMQELSSVDTSSVDLSTVKSPLLMRNDIPSTPDRSKWDILLSVSPQRVIAHQIALPAII